MGNKRFYPLHQSPLYTLSSKKRLAALLGTTQTTIKSLSSPDCYNEFKTKKGREVQEPNFELKRIHSHLKNLLCSINPPSYLFSGVKGRSYVNNAAVHKKSRFFLTADTYKFYPHCKEKYVLIALITDFKMQHDVAEMLAKIITFKGIIPTGSPVSQILSYFAYSRTFDRLAMIAQNSGLQFSLYVDDITFSSQKPIPSCFYPKIKYELKKVNLKLHAEKTRSYGSLQHKKVTGCVISPNGELLVPNKLRKKIIEGAMSLEKKFDKKVLKSLIGRIRSAQSIEKGLFQSTLEKFQTIDNLQK